MDMTKQNISELETKILNCVHYSPHSMSVKPTQVAELIAYILAKQQSTSQNVLDAERYRFMCKTNMTDIYSDYMIYKLNPFYVDFVDLDAAIDFAMRDGQIIKPLAQVTNTKIKKLRFNKEDSFPSLT